MENFFRSFCMTICSALFNFIPTLYNLFYDLAANHELISSTKLDEFSNNIYVLVSVVMLFAFAVKAIESIINPDMLFDSKKGFASVIKRSVIALVLIVGVPFGFDLFYEFQDEVMAKSLIEKVIIGVSINNNETGEENLAEKSGAGQMLASTALSSVLYPREEDTCTEYEDMDACAKYNDAMIDISKVGKLILDINEKVGDGDDAEYVLNYEGYGLLSIIVGVVIIYMLVLFCMDTALRLIKMAFLELTAPISIVAYIFGGNDILKKWWKEVSGTAFSLFGRIAGLALMIFVLSLLPDFVDNNFEGLEGKIINLLIIMATLMFVKEAPNMIEKIFGIKIGGKGGIAGRLGSMAGVGNIAKSAWEKIRTVGATVGGVALGGVLGAGALGVGALTNPLIAGAAAGGGFLGKKIADSLRNTKFGENVKTVGNVLRSVGNEKNPIKAVKSGANTYKESPVSIANKQKKNKKMADDIRDKLGIDENGKVRDAIASLSSYNDVVGKSKFVPATVKEALNNRNNANAAKSRVETMEKKSNHISETISEAIGNTRDEATKKKLSQLDYDRKKGNITTDEFLDNIKQSEGTGVFTTGQAKEIRTDMTNITGLAKAAGLDDIVFKDGKMNMGELKGAISFTTDQANIAQTNLDNIESKITDETQKNAISEYKSASDKIITQYVKDVGKTGTNYDSYAFSGTGSNSSNYDVDEAAAEALYEAQMAQNEERERKNLGGTNSSSSDNSNSRSSSDEANTNSSHNSTSGNNSDEANTNSSYNPNAGSNSGLSEQDLSGFFDGLSKDIKDANAETNSILNDSLKTQRDTLKESRKQNSTLNNISSGVDNLNNTVDQMNSNIKNFSNNSNKNLKDISQKLDDMNRNNNE